MAHYSGNHDWEIFTNQSKWTVRLDIVLFFVKVSMPPPPLHPCTGVVRQPSWILPPLLWNDCAESDKGHMGFVFLSETGLTSCWTADRWPHTGLSDPWPLSIMSRIGGNGAAFCWVVESGGNIDPAALAGFSCLLSCSFLTDYCDLRQSRPAFL